MKKTSIYLGLELDRRLARFAAARGISKAEAIRRSIEHEVAGTSRPRITAIGIAEGPGDVATNDERYLLESNFGRD